MADTIQNTDVSMSQILSLIKEENTVEYYPNGLKVSKTNNPMFFPAANTYQIGSSEIVAMCSNAIAVGTGQTGSAPLYVFTKDGVYALFVDASGELAYTNSRIIARDVCNNAKSVTPIDTGVVFTTDRGLMSIAGEQVEEIGQPLEGDWMDVTIDSLLDKAYRLPKLAWLEQNSALLADFLLYLKNSIVAYNHNERELMVSNPDYEFTYIMDRNGNWSRRDYTATEYVNNYPTTYRMLGGKLYQVDEGSDTDNGVFLLTKEIKLDSIGFKELHRVVARGWFDSGIPSNIELKDAFEELGKTVRITTKESEDYYYLKTTTFTVPSGKTSVTIPAFSFKLQYGDSENDDSEVLVAIGGSGTVCSKTNGVYTFPGMTIQVTAGNTYTIRLWIECEHNSGSWVKYTPYSVPIITERYLDLYVQGSYDGRKWATLGIQRRKGKFTDIGCLVERNDCRYFRFCLAGHITKDSRFDYFEVASKQSKLSTKIR